jgi:hypothetical protein
LTTRIDPPHTSTQQPAAKGVDLQRVASPNATRPSTTGVTATSAVAAALKPAAPSARSSTQFISGDDDEAAASHKLSRAERKRLRKQQRAERYDDE